MPNSGPEEIILEITPDGPPPPGGGPRKLTKSSRPWGRRLRDSRRLILITMVWVEEVKLMARVVITMEGGLIQHIMADTEDVQVMVLDYDTEGGDDERIKEFEGNQVYIMQGVDDVDPIRVEEIARRSLSKNLI